MIKIYGYLRISTDKQNIDNNKSEILLKANKLGFNNINIEWVEETVSGKKHWRKRKLGELLNKCNKDDVIITSELSRIGRKIKDIFEFCSVITEKGVKLYMTKTDFKVDDSVQSQVMIFAYSLSAQIERELISERTKTALQKRKQEGLPVGRKKGYSKLNFYKDEVIELLNNKIPKCKIAEKYNVNRNTITKFIKIHNL
jgi:DNA invertase Pin-like site-specific DNA recombinase